MVLYSLDGYYVALAIFMPVMCISSVLGCRTPYQLRVRGLATRRAGGNGHYQGHMDTPSLECGLPLQLVGYANKTAEEEWVKVLLCMQSEL